MSVTSDLARLSLTIDRANELLLSEQSKMVDVGGGVMRPTNAMVMTNLATLLGGAMPYVSVAAGMEGTANGTNFSVLSSADDEYVEIYRNEGGSPVYVDSYPNAKAVEALNARIGVLDSTTVAHQFEDGNRFIIAKILENGALDLLNGTFITRGKGLSIDGPVDAGGAKLSATARDIELTDANGFGIARFGMTDAVFAGLNVKDSDQNTFEIVDVNGFVIFRPDMPAAGSAGVVQRFARLVRQQVTQYMHVLGYGQSLIRGVGAQPAVSLSQPYGNVMIASGVKIRPGEAGYDASAFVPLVESTAGTEGESPVTSLCNGVVRRALDDGEVADDWVFVGASTGRSGKSIEALSFAGEGDAEKTVQLVKDCMAIAKAAGKTYSVWAYAWAQGETNYTGTWTRSAYKYAQMELALFDEMTRRVVDITGQEFQPYLFTYQVGAHRKYSIDNMSIALAHWRISRERPDVVLAVPVYIMPVGPDVLHLTNEGSWLMGEYFSRAMYETMIRRNGKWRPLEPEQVNWTDAHIDIRFHVPSGSLVLDNTLASSTPNFGFDIREAGTVVTNIISSVTVIASDTVRISLNRAAATDAVLSYARGRNGDPEASGPVTGARGNLRDTHGLFDTAISPLGNTFALHNPCVMFQYSRKTGF